MGGALPSPSVISDDHREQWVELTHELGSGTLHVELPSRPIFEGNLSVRSVIQFQLLPERLGRTVRQRIIKD